METGTPALPAEIFKAYDIRGIVGQSLTTAIVHRVGQAFGSEALARGIDSVIIARDGRLSGPELAAALSAGLCASGCSVIDIGMLPTPLLYFATHQLGSGTGIMLTGSHNPPEYNGLKMVMAGETLSGERIQALRQRCDSGELASGAGRVRSADIKPDYLARVIGEGKLARPLHAVVDCGNGVASEVAVDVQREKIKTSPAYDRAVPIDPEYEERLADHYGLVKH